MAAKAKIVAMSSKYRRGGKDRQSLDVIAHLVPAGSKYRRGGEDRQYNQDDDDDHGLFDV